jgi:hypothetical protein
MNAYWSIWLSAGRAHRLLSIFKLVDASQKLVRLKRYRRDKVAHKGAILYGSHYPTRFLDYQRGRHCASRNRRSH